MGMQSLGRKIEEEDEGLGSGRRAACKGAARGRRVHSKHKYATVLDTRERFNG